MKLLLLGRTGQVGHELLRSLTPHGEVIAPGRDTADLAHPDRITALVDAVRPDIIVNAAAHTAVDRAESEPALADMVNHLAVAALAGAAARRGAWLIHYSTDYVFDGGKAGAWLETDSTAPLNIYGQTKRAGELAIAASGARHFIFRTSWVHSGHGRNFIATMLRLAAERDHLSVVADQVGAPTAAAFIADVTAHAVAAIASGASMPPGIYHLAAAGETSWHGLAQFAIAEALSLGLPLRLTPAGIAPISTADYPTPARRPLNSRLDIAKLTQASGLVFPDWRVHVRDTVQALSARGQGSAA